MDRLDSIWHKNSFLSSMLSRVFPNKNPTAQGKGLSSDYNESVISDRTQPSSSPLA